MRDLRKGRKFGREKDQRNALLKSLAVSLIMHSKIKTTLPKAKETRPHVERLITHAKKGGVAGYRIARKFLPAVAADRLMKEVAPKYADRKGGYTRIVKLPRRRGDAAPMAFIELV